MNIGYHDVKIHAYTTGANDNGKKLMDLDLVNEAGEHQALQMYFASPESIRISLEQLGGLGWSKDHPEGLDAILGAYARIEVYEDPWTDNEGNERTTLKAKFVRARKPAVSKPMSKAAAHDFLAELADPHKPPSAFGPADPGREPPKGW